MPDERIEIEIDTEGNLTVEKHDGVGATCLTEISEILAGVGEKKTVKKKPEYTQRVKDNATKRIKR